MKTRWTAAEFAEYLKSGKEPVDTTVPAPVAKKRKAAHTRGQMNRTEQEYAMRLEARRQVGEIRSWTFESVTFHLAPDTSYTPDFLVVTASGLELHEVKGAYVWEDSWVKFKIAAALFPFARWFWCQKSDGAWMETERTA